LLAPLFANVTGETRTASQRFNEPIARLYSKAWSASFLKRILARRHSEEGPASWLCTEDEVGVAVDTLEGALEAIAVIRRRGHHRIVAKEALGLAGQNAIRLWEPELLVSQRQWLARALQNGRQVVIEPWLEREADFSVQLEMEPRGLKLCGYTGLINDRKGQFQANYAEVNFARRIPSKVTALFSEVPDSSRQFQRLYDDIFSRLEVDLRNAGFVGPLGIDAFVYRTAEGGYRLKAIVEINPRYTMGRVTVELMKQTCPGSHGVFRLVNGAQLRAEGFADFPSYANALSERFPLRLEGEPVPKIKEGVICLNEPGEAHVCLATFQVSR
jgi:hypothetical protein